MSSKNLNHSKLTIFLHWLSALIIFSMFALGFWMVDLGYYHAWRKSAPELHKSIGLMFFAITLLRVFWKLKTPTLAPVEGSSDKEIKIAHLVHKLLYFLLFFIMLSGYLISTADERGIEFFNLFSVPGFGSFIENQEDVAGLFHQFAAYTIISLALLHAAAAFKHHFVSKDETLKRMLGTNKN